MIEDVLSVYALFSPQFTLNLPSILLRKETSFIKSKEIVVSAVYWGIWQEMTECSYKTLYFAGFENVKQMFNSKNLKSSYQSLLWLFKPQLLLLYHHQWFTVNYFYKWSCGNWFNTSEQVYQKLIFLPDLSTSS